MFTCGCGAKYEIRYWTDSSTGDIGTERYCPNHCVRVSRDDEIEIKFSELTTNLRAAGELGSTLVWAHLHTTVLADSY